MLIEGVFIVFGIVYLKSIIGAAKLDRIQREAYGMAEEMIGDDSLTTATTLQRLREDLDWLKLSYDKSARSDRSTTEKFDAVTTRFDSVEKKIESLGTESNTKFDSLEKRMFIITEILTRLEDTAVFHQRHGKEIASSSQHPNDQVPMDLSEPKQPHSNLGYRGIHSTLANRDKMLRKIDMPVFAGPLPFDWISRAERFFRIGNYNEEEKLQLVSLSLEGPVLQWFNGEVLSDPFVNWEQFTKRMLDRFGVVLTTIQPHGCFVCVRRETLWSM